MNGKSTLVDLAAREALRPQPQAVQVDPFMVAAQYFGLSGLAAQALGMTLEPCLCGGCSGKRVVFNHGLHASRTRGPEVISRFQTAPTDKEPA